MIDFEVALLVMVFFLLRIGIPVLVLIVLGTIIERWQIRSEQAERLTDDQTKPV